MKTLKYGDTGSEVKLLQSALNRAGSQLTIDGVFGSKTVSVVKLFQTMNGLTADGIVGSKTWEALKPYLTDAKTFGEAVLACLNDIEELPSFIKVMELMEYVRS